MADIRIGLGSSMVSLIKEFFVIRQYFRGNHSHIHICYCTIFRILEHCVHPHLTFPNLQTFSFRFFDQNVFYKAKKDAKMLSIENFESPFYFQRDLQNCLYFIHWRHDRILAITSFDRLRQLFQESRHKVPQIPNIQSLKGMAIDDHRLVQRSFTDFVLVYF